MPAIHLQTVKKRESDSKPTDTSCLIVCDLSSKIGGVRSPSVRAVRLVRRDTLLKHVVVRPTCLAHFILHWTDGRATSRCCSSLQQYSRRWEVAFGLKEPPRTQLCYLSLTPVHPTPCPRPSFLSQTSSAPLQTNPTSWNWPFAALSLLHIPSLRRFPPPQFRLRQLSFQDFAPLHSLRPVAITSPSPLPSMTTNLTPNRTPHRFHRRRTRPCVSACLGPWSIASGVEQAQLATSNGAQVTV